MNKYEQLIEYIINDDEAKAKALFHDIVVAKSREIYESLMDEEMEEEGMGGNPVEDLANEVSADEEGMAEADDEEGEGDEDFGTDDDMGGEMPDMDSGDDMGGEGDIEDRVMDLEAALDELKAEFDAMMGDEAGGDMGGDDMGMDMGGDDMDMDMGMDKPENEMMYEEEEEEEEEKEDDEEAKTESRRNRSAADQIREYVEKVSDGHGAEKSGAGEGHEVGKGGSASVNKQSIVAKKNDMGGTAGNIVKGGSEQAPDGSSPKGKAGGFLKSAQEIDVAKRNVNKPGGNKGAQDWYGNKAKAKSAEGSTTAGSMSVNKQSLEPGSK